MIKNKYYLLQVECKNCDYKYEVKIPKGMKYEDIKCEQCGLKELKKQMPHSIEPAPEICV